MTPKERASAIMNKSGEENPIQFHIMVEEIEAAIVAALNEHNEEVLRAAVIKHRAVRADDRCIEDDDVLYAALGDGIKCDRRVGSKLEMLHNCARFIERRCEGGGWPSYVELEVRIEELKAQLEDIMAGVRASHAVLDDYGVRREDEVDKGGGVYLVTEYPVHRRIQFALEAANPKEGAT